jgi:hypothetical protein
MRSLSGCAWSAARWGGGSAWVVILSLSLTAAGAELPAAPAAGEPPGPREMAASRMDVWGEAILRRPGGPSFEAFRDLLPPLRYVNTRFRHYPIVLSAPAAPVKARWVSNGSAVNARADKKPMWKEAGFPVSFQVGEAREPFGDDPTRVDGPRYVDGYLPVVRVSYRQGQTVYGQEAFAPVRGRLAESGAVFVRISARDADGVIVARPEVDQPVTADAGSLRDGEGRGLILFGPGWEWDAGKKELRARPASGRPVFLAVLTQPLPAPLPALSEAEYEAERAACLGRWSELLGRGLHMSIPEPVVQDAWRALVIGNFLIAVGDRMHYSAGNAYDHLYEAECGDAVRSLLLYGFTEEARRMVVPMLEFNREATRFHVAGHKLQLLAHYYWVTRDAQSLRAWEPLWRPVVEFLIGNRRKDNGLMPPDNYAGDIGQQVFSLSSNANCWRGLRDIAAVLEDVGEHGRAEQVSREARSLRAAILDAVDKSERRDARPPFIPIALFGTESPYETLTETRFGSYYDLMAPYVLGSTVFGPGAERETWMIDYLRTHGGVAMGMIRSTPHQGEFNNEPGVNVLYGLRYGLTLLRRDDRDHALLGFYGQLAQAMTRDTFIGGEGSRFLHGDSLGRSFYLPPNSASNATFLTMLRYLLVQDWDLDDDGHPETLRLLYGIPDRWLNNGSVLEVERAPTAFGPVSFRVESRLNEGRVTLAITPPRRKPASFSIRPPLPAGWKMARAQVGDALLPVRDDGSIDVSSQAGRFVLDARVERLKDDGKGRTTKPDR